MSIFESSSKYDAMSMVELNDLKKKLGSQSAALNRQINKRKEYLKQSRYPGYDPSIKGDAEIIELKLQLNDVNREISILKEYKRNRQAFKEVEEARAKLEKRKIALEVAQFEAENKDFIDSRNAKADERRPDKPKVWFGSEFNNIKGAEKRLIMMMAREIGQARYQELKRIAYWDEQHGNNHYYTGSYKFDNGRGGC